MQKDQNVETCLSIVHYIYIYYIYIYEFYSSSYAAIDLFYFFLFLAIFGYIPHSGIIRYIILTIEVHDVH